MWDPQHHRFQYFTDLMLDNLGYPHDLIPPYFFPEKKHENSCMNSIGIATLGFDNWKRQHQGSLLRYIQCEPYLLDAPNQNYWASKIIRQTFVKNAFNFALLMVILGRTTNKPPEIGKYHLFYHIRYLRLLEEYIPIHFYYRVCGISMYSITV